MHAGDQRIHTVSDQPFDMLQAMNAAGPLLNASNDDDANISLDRGDFWEDEVGNVYMGMYAKGIIAKGSFLHWNYDYKAGRGGADAFSFPDD